MRGARGDDVAELQHCLRRAGWSVAIDGDFGLRTEAAVRAVQVRAHLPVDGIAGPHTIAALRRGVPPSTLSDPVRTLISVPYLSQRDNVYEPGGTCNVTCLAMVLAYYGVEPRGHGQLEDELFAELEGPEAQAVFRRDFAEAAAQGFRPRHVHGMLAWLAEQHGMTARFEAGATWTRIATEIDEHRPVILSGRFTASGHLVVLIGRTTDGDLIVHDPWGDWTRGYRGAPDGAARIYPFAETDAVLRGDERRRGRWAHFIRPRPRRAGA